MNSVEAGMAGLAVATLCAISITLAALTVPPAADRFERWCRLACAVGFCALLGALLARIIYLHL